MSEAPRELRLVLVEWVDSATPAETGWRWHGDIANVPRVLRHYTAGWLLEEDDRQMILAGNIGEMQAEDRQVQHLTAIPKSAILGTKNLSRKRLW